MVFVFGASQLKGDAQWRQVMIGTSSLHDDVFLSQAPLSRHRDFFSYD